MTEIHSTLPATQDQDAPDPTTPLTTGRPAKPYPAFPLTPHASGKWQKKIRGKTHYFGRWDDPDGALAEYMEQKDALHAGREPKPDADALTVKSLTNQYLNHKQAFVDAGELTVRTMDDYKATCDLLVKTFGGARLVDDLGPEDFARLRKTMAETWGPVRLGNMIQMLRSVFKFAADNALASKPIIYGQGFKRPTKKTLRLHKAKQGAKLFTTDEVRRIIDAAGPQLKAMLLLGINCGFGNSDCGKLPLSALDLERGWVNYPRPKTGIDRRCPLWPETITAIKEALANRPKAKKGTDAALVFITKYGAAWTKEIRTDPDTKEAKAIRDTAITGEMAKRLHELGINGRKGLGFYSLRHTFRTVADEVKDQPAADFIMGHESPHMSSVYREKIGDDRLKAVVDHVRAWLFPPKKSLRRKSSKK